MKSGAILGVFLLVLGGLIVWRPWASEVGTRCASEAELFALQREQGFLNIGSFPGGWPAEIVLVERGRDSLQFRRDDGTAQIYSGFDGYDLKAVHLQAEGGVRSVYVFRTERPRS